MPRIVRLENPIRPYAWGSSTAIANLLGIDPPGTPQAELWIGAHPQDPSRLEGASRSLYDVVKDDPAQILGPEVARRFDGQLPFLLKVLAAARPLSIQCHPNLAQAKAGFAREDAAQIPRTAPHRNYKDDNHKPELICALTPFVALCGFRPLAQIVSLIEALHIDGLTPILANLRDQPNREGLKAMYRQLMTASPERRTAWANAAAKAAQSHQDDDAAYAWMVKLAGLYPDDVGGLSPLFLNLVTLAPGEALYLGAGSLHAYLDGTGVEIMANSDNVLRGGLTPKHVDVPELLDLLTFDFGPVDILHPEGGGAHQRYSTPAEEFMLETVELNDATYHRQRGPRVEILLCTDGAMTVTADEPVSLAKGQTALVPAVIDAYQLRGTGKVFIATVP